jgi:hypothetical protein
VVDWEEGKERGGGGMGGGGEGGRRGIVCAKDRKMVENEKNYIIIINFMISFLNREETKKEIKQKNYDKLQCHAEYGNESCFWLEGICCDVVRLY